MSELRKERIRKRCFFFAAVIKDAGLQDFVRIGRTLGATLQDTIGLFIVHLYTTCGLGGPTRQCLRENEQYRRGSSYPVLLWKIRSDSTENLRYFSLFNRWSSQSGKNSAGDSLLESDFMISHEWSYSVKVDDQACALLEHTRKHCTHFQQAADYDGCWTLNEGIKTC